MTSCSLQKLLADLGVNVILVTTLAKHCSYICFKIGTLNSPRGGKKFSRGGGGGTPPPPPLKETSTIMSCPPSYGVPLFCIVPPCILWGIVQPSCSSCLEAVYMEASYPIARMKFKSML